jgi:hypothetical protein
MCQLIRLRTCTHLHLNTHYELRRQKQSTFCWKRVSLEGATGSSPLPRNTFISVISS